MLLDNFPEIIAFEPRCKLCQLGRDNPPVLRLVHSYRTREQLGDYAIRARIKPALSNWGITLPTARSIGRHFDNHVNFSIAPNEIPQALRDSVSFDEDSLKAANPKDAALGLNDSDYVQMWDLFVRLMRRITALDDDPSTFRNPDGSHAFAKLNTWASLIKEARQTIEGLNKMRNADKMTIHLLEQHTHKYAVAIAEPLASELREVYTEISMILDPRARQAAARIEALLETQIPALLYKAAEEAMASSKDQYKLLN